MAKQTFKNYNQQQSFLLPPDIEELIPDNHLVRIINEVLDKIDISGIEETYKGGGASAYHPRCLMKVLLYGYLDGIYSSRKLAKACRENIIYFWLAGNQKPDFHTLNRFRSERMREEIKTLFKQVVLLAEELGYIDFSVAYVDGTKVEANANKHKMVWKKNIQRWKASAEEKIEQLLQEIEEINKEEDALYQGRDLPEVEPEKTSSDKQATVQNHVEKINQRLARKKKSREKQLEHYQGKKAGYEQAEATLGARNSYSKTDTEATAMKMKDESIKPGYNLMIATEQQIITGYTVEDQGNDGSCFPALMKEVVTRPQAVVGDQAFGTEENYAYCEAQEIESYLKYSGFHREQTKKYQQNRYRKENFRYNPEAATYTCPEGAELSLSRKASKETRSGYRQELKVYQSASCKQCPARELCTKNSRGRVLQVSEKLEHYKNTTRQLLCSEKGQTYRRNRGPDVETPFGELKQNKGFRRCMLRGKGKVSTEIGIHCTSHNLKKIARNLQKDKKAAAAMVLIPVFYQESADLLIAA